MPEIWIGYGSTHVVLDIKQENLLQFEPEMNLMTDEEIKNALRDIKVSKKTLIILLSSSKYLVKVLSFFLDINKSDNTLEIEIGVFFNDLVYIQNYFQNNKIFQIDKKDFHERIKKFDNIVFLSKIGYDPLFGFSGTPSIIVRNFVNDLMTEIFKSIEIIRPIPGQINDSLKMALEYYDKISVQSIDILSNKYGITNIYYGSSSKNFKDAIFDFKTNTIFNIEEQKSLIVSSGSEFENHKTLNNSLYSLWNSIGVLKKQGTAVLLAENSHGIGEGALTMYLEAKLNLLEIKKTKYVNGLEHLIYLTNLKDEYNLGLVSSLPFYYVQKKFGLNTYNNIKQVLENIISHYGKSNKILICPDPTITLFIKK
jgi:hypothetical protein